MPNLATDFTPPIDRDAAFRQIPGFQDCGVTGIASRTGRELLPPESVHFRSERTYAWSCRGKSNKEAREAGGPLPPARGEPPFRRRAFARLDARRQPQARQRRPHRRTRIRNARIRRELE